MYPNGIILNLFKCNVKWCGRSRDGCAGQYQYQGKGAFFGWQTMKACHGLECENKRKPANHAKDRTDGTIQA